jgi:dihydrofolate synthase/folylpolyglutamate synthase
MNAPIVFAEDKPEIASAEPTSDGGMLYHTPCFGDIMGDLGGIYQQKNLNTVFFALNAIARKGFLCECKDEVNKEKCLTELLQGIAHVKDNTGLMGRWQVIQNAPKVVCDTGHNVGGWQYISAQLSSVNCQSMHIIFGMVDDKDINGVLDLLPKNAQYYFTKANNHRALSETVLSDLASKHGLVGETYPSVYEAYNAAKAIASHSDFIFVGGSSYVVGDFLKNCL